MPTFTIETTYHLSVYRRRSYEAVTVEDACHRAIEDDDWADEKPDHDTTGKTYVSGIWQGTDAAYQGSALPIPPQFGELIQRKADHFEVLLGVLKILARAGDLTASHVPFWLSRAQAAIAKAEAILAGAPDPD